MIHRAQNCQEYLRTLTDSITPEALLRLPISTFIAIIGCGDPGLIDMYASATNCPFPHLRGSDSQALRRAWHDQDFGVGHAPCHHMKKSLLKSSIESGFPGA